MTGGGTPAIVVAATPTSNGDLHVGHIAGPYLAGDVYARYLRATGRPTVYTTCTDDSQSYVLTTARRQGVAPDVLCGTSTAAIGRSLEALGISMAGLPPIDERYRATVLEFVTALHSAGRFRLRTVRLPYAQRADRFLFDGLVTGECPVCLATSSGGVCESCGHPNNFDELADPRSSMDPDDPVTVREQSVLVLPMEDYRQRLTAYYAAREGDWRPHAMQLVRELLARPLPEVPVTIPGEWGIPAPFPETPGQVLYPWIEAMPASMYSTWWTAARQGTRTADVDAHWRTERGAELVYFHGFDNTYHWGMLDLVLLMAHGDRYVLPRSNVCNEFYELRGEKFSTSRRHLIWSADLLAEVPRDLVRFYLALTAPEYQRTDFSIERLRAVAARRLVQPWNGLADAISLALVDTAPGTPLATTSAGRRRAAVMSARFRLCYELSTFSPARAAETALGELARLRSAADVLTAGTGPAATADLLLQLRTLLAWSAPILLDTAGQAGRAGIDLALTAAADHTVPAFVPPRLPAPDRAPAPEAVRVGGPS